MKLPLAALERLDVRRSTRDVWLSHSRATEKAWRGRTAATLSIVEPEFTRNWNKNAVLRFGGHAHR